MINRTAQRQVRAEAVRLIGLPRQQARHQLSDRIARAYLLEGDAQRAQFDFNARLATELRELADASDAPSLWSGR